MTNPDAFWASEDTLAEIRGLAARKVHRLSPSMCGTQPLQQAAASKVLAFLSGRCPDRDQGAAVAPAPRREHTQDVTATSKLPRPYRLLLELVPDGYYATPSRTGHNDLDFWWVHTKKSGKRKDQRFVERYLGGTGPVWIDPMQGRYAMEAILATGLEEAGNLFADKLGKCRDCGQPLTDEESRAARRGPVCRAK